MPAIKSLGKSNATVSATRQLLDDVARARQLAMSQRTTVYMVFVPTNFWANPYYNASYTTWLNNLTEKQKIALTNLLDKQLTGYTFISMRTVGDQPGQMHTRYLARWQSLPDGAFIAKEKFSQPGIVVSSQASPLYSFWNSDYPEADNNRIYAFTNMAVFSFPTEDTVNQISLPCIAFNYLGQLTFDSVNLADRDEYIPLARGTVSPGIDTGTRALVFGTASADENPPGNSTNISYNIIHIDRLTGRARLEFQKVQ